METKLTTIVVRSDSSTAGEMLFPFDTQKQARQFARDILLLSVKDAEHKDDGTRFFYIFTLPVMDYLSLRTAVQTKIWEKLTKQYRERPLNALYGLAQQLSIYPQLSYSEITRLDPDRLARDIAWFDTESRATVGWIA